MAATLSAIENFMPSLEQIRVNKLSGWASESLDVYLDGKQMQRWNKIIVSYALLHARDRCSLMKWLSLTLFPSQTSIQRMFSDVVFITSHSWDL